MGYAILKRRFVLLACWLLMLAACGGGGGGEGGSSGADPGTAPSGALTVQQRSVAVDRMADRFQQITGGVDTPTADMWEQLRSWVMGQPEFSDAGVGDQVLWARFRDGRYFLFTDNWRPLPQSQLASAQSVLKKAAPSALLQQELPGSDQALMLSDSDQAFADSGPLMARMSDGLFQSGWSVTTQQALHIDMLKSPRTLGFLFLTAHSGIIGPTGEKQFAMITDDLATSDNDESFKADLDDGTLIYHRDRKFLEGLFNRGLRYAITEKFVSRYLHFSPEALVILAACHSGSAEAAGFRNAIQQAGGGTATVVGWDGNTNAQAYEMVDLLVDRLTGMNVVRPVTPANRPFNFADVWKYLGDKGLLQTPSPEGTVMTPVLSFGSGFSILRPVLRDLENTGIDKMVLHGEFGNAPATVQVGAATFPATTLAGGNELMVDLTPDAKGDVVVTTRNRHSNRRQLGSWRGQLSYKQTMDSGCPRSPFSNTVDINLHLRADAHAVRFEVDGPLHNNERLLMPASDTTATWKAEGSCTQGDGDTTTYSGSGKLPLTWIGPGAPVAQNPNFLVARLDALQDRFQIQFAVGGERLVILTTSNGSSHLALSFGWHLSEFVNPGNDPTLLGAGYFLRMDASRNVRAGQFTKGEANQPERALSAQWGSMPMTPAFDDRVPR
jgi:hypothetical protein